VLKAIADALTGQSRDYDKVGRFGGEEFVLLLAQTTEQDACKIAERLRNYVASLTVPADDKPDAPLLSVTVSIGVTALARDETRELSDLLAAADSAMYHAKQSGRNCVAFAPPLRDMGMSAMDAAAALGSEPLPVGGTPLSGHRVELVLGDQATASLCPRR
jgi:PleD family two-component response regulator